MNGNMVQCDDTSKFEFIGIVKEYTRPQVDPIDTIQNNGITGDKMFDVEQPLMFMALIAAAAAGDEGRNVYWLYNNQVQYTPGNNGNFAGKIWWVKDPTHVLVVPPWMIPDLFGGTCDQVLSGSINTTLTKFDVGKTFEVPATTPVTITLPPTTKVGSGAQMIFVNTGNTSQTVTLSPASGDTINGSATLAMGTAQYSRVTLQSRGPSLGWIVVGL